MGTRYFFNFLLMATLVCMIPLNVDCERLPQASLVLGSNHHRQPKQFLPLDLLPIQNPNYPNYPYNRYYSPRQSLGPFFGYFPYLFPQAPTTTTTTTTTTTAKPPNNDPLTKCTSLKNSPNCPSDCMDITATGGTIQSLGYENGNYDDNSDCAYFVSVAEGKKIKLTLSTGAYFDLVTSGQLELLRVFSVSDAQLNSPVEFGEDKLLGSFPTTQEIVVGTSTTNMVVLSFFSDNTTCPSGKTCKWEVKYEVV